MMKSRVFRSFAFTVRCASEFTDFYMHEVASTGIFPSAETDLLPKVGAWTGSYEAFHDFAIDSITAINSMGYGLGLGIIAFSLGMRALYSPFILYSQVCALKMQMLAPEMAAYKQAMNRIYKGGNRAALTPVNEEFMALKRRYGIRSGLQMMPMTQLPLILFFFWTLQDMAYGIEQFPGMETDGFLWFKNLSEPDPYFLLPLLLAFSTFISVHKSPNTAQLTGPIAKFAKYLKYFAFLSLPISSTFPAGIVLNWLIMSLFQLTCNALVYTKTGRKLLRIPEYLPGSLLDRMNTKRTAEVFKPKIFTKKPPQELSKGNLKME